MFKVNNKDIRRTTGIQLSTYFTPCSSVSLVNFEHVIAGWDKLIFPIISMNSIRNKSKLLVERAPISKDILMISNKNFEKSFPVFHFCIIWF